MEVKDIIGITAALAFIAFSIFLFVPSLQPEISLTVTESFSQALWEFRSLDVFLQILIILAGAFSVLILVKEKR